MTAPGSEMEGFLAARDQMIACVEHVLAHHRPERNPEQKVVTCTKVYDPEPHAIIPTQWPGWRGHVAPQIVDALFDLILAGAHRCGGDDDNPNPNPIKEAP